MIQNKVKLGKFTASGGSNLFVGGEGKTRDKYIREKAEEVVRGEFKYKRGNKHTDHGEMYELEGIENFALVSGLIVEALDQKYFPINDNCGATPDCKVVDFTGGIIASCDLKCPTETFFEQKMMFVECKNAKYQNVPKEYFYQAQMQMLSLKVDDHYLVRYLTNSHTDEFGNKIEYDLPLEARIFWQVIKADKEVQTRILEAVEQAAKERDNYIKIFKQPIIPVQEKEETIALLDIDDHYPPDYSEKISKGKELRKKLNV